MVYDMANLNIIGEKEDIEYIKQKLSKNLVVHLAIILGNTPLSLYSSPTDRSAYNKAYYKAHKKFILLKHRQRARRIAKQKK